MFIIIHVHVVQEQLPYRHLCPPLSVLSRWLLLIDWSTPSSHWRLMAWTDPHFQQQVQDPGAPLALPDRSLYIQSLLQCLSLTVWERQATFLPDSVYKHVNVSTVVKIYLVWATNLLLWPLKVCRPNFRGPVYYIVTLNNFNSSMDK